MSSATFNPSTVPQGLYEVSATQLAPLGSTLQLNDGRHFVYCENGGVALASGLLVQGEAVAANHGYAGNSLAVTNDTGVLGTKTCTVTLGATAAAENLYAEGYMLTMTGTGVGDAYKISGHPAIASGAAGVFTMADPFYASLDDAIEVALTKHPCKDLIVKPATPATAMPIGIPIRDVPLDNYCWIQTRGICCCLFTGTPVAGSHAVCDDGVIGGLAPEAAAIDEPLIGIVHGAGVTAEHSVIFLTLS